MFGYINAGESIGLAFSTFATHAGFNITIMSAVVRFYVALYLIAFFSTISIGHFVDESS